MRKDIIIGQECICPDGLGRVADIRTGVAGSVSLNVDTYIDNRSCFWDINNVKLIPLPEPISLNEYGFYDKIN